MAFKQTKKLQIISDDVAFDGIDVTSVTFSITVNEVNRPPVADAGGPYTGVEGSAISLDASGSFDPDLDAVIYEWDLDNNGQYDDATGVTGSDVGLTEVVDGAGSTALGVGVEVGTAIGVGKATIC